MSVAGAAGTSPQVLLVSEAATCIDSGDVVPLCVLGSERSEFYPDVSCASEVGDYVAGVNTGCGLRYQQHTDIIVSAHNGGTVFGRAIIRDIHSMQGAERKPYFPPGGGEPVPAAEDRPFSLPHRRDPGFLLPELFFPMLSPGRGPGARDFAGEGQVLLPLQADEHHLQQVAADLLVTWGSPP